MLRTQAKSIGELIRQYLRVTQIEAHVFEGRIAEVWQATLGDVITRETERIHLNNGVLFVELRSAALKQELMMRRTAIRNALNEKLGQEIIKQVVVR